MAIEKVLGPLDLPEDDIEDVEIEIINPDAVSIEDEDGSITFDFSGELSGRFLVQTTTTTLLISSMMTS
jgi:hypothetical protein